MRSFLLTVLGLMATPSLAIIHKAQEGISIFEAVRNLKSARNGYLHIAPDGVARSYDENESVIDYIPLTNDQLREMLLDLPDPWQQEADHLHEEFYNMDGRRVVDEQQLLNPPPELRNPMARREPQSNRDLGPLFGIADYYCGGQPCC